MTAEEKKSLQRTTVYFRSDVIKHLKLLAVALDKDASALINDAVAEYIERNKGELQKIAQEISKK